MITQLSRFWDAYLGIIKIQKLSWGEVIALFRTDIYLICEQVSLIHKKWLIPKSYLWQSIIYFKAGKEFR